MSSTHISPYSRKAASVSQDLARGYSLEFLRMFANNIESSIRRDREREIARVNAAVGLDYVPPRAPSRRLHRPPYLTLADLQYERHAIGLPDEERE